MLQKIPSLVILVFVSLLAGGVISLSWLAAIKEIEYLSKEIITSPGAVAQAISAQIKPPPRIAKGLYLTAYSAGSEKKLNEIIKLIDSTELNAVVIDIKDYSGLVLYDSKLPLVNEFKLKDSRYPDLKGVINKLHRHNIYVIARQTVFQDPVLAAAKPEWALKDKNGGLWHDHKGLSWVDATKSEVWRYNMAIAKEAISYGFDEINFDYVRFPSDGDITRVVYGNVANKKYQTMDAFFAYVNKSLAAAPAWTSIDMFGLVMEATGNNDLNIGQRLADARNNVDYISPMMYPSHYPSGHLGLQNPADHPDLVFENGMKIGSSWFTSTTRAQVRPWIQAFNLGAVYDATKIRAQIDTIEKFPNAGWLMWNASNRYTDAGLKTE